MQKMMKIFLFKLTFKRKNVVTFRGWSFVPGPRVKYLLWNTLIYMAFFSVFFLNFSFRPFRTCCNSWLSWSHPVCGRIEAQSSWDNTFVSRPILHSNTALYWIRLTKRVYNAAPNINSPYSKPFVGVYQRMQHLACWMCAAAITYSYKPRIH